MRLVAVLTVAVVWLAAAGFPGAAEGHAYLDVERWNLSETCQKCDVASLRYYQALTSRHLDHGIKFNCTELSSTESDGHGLCRVTAYEDHWFEHEEEVEMIHRDMYGQRLYVSEEEDANPGMCFGDAPPPPPPSQWITTVFSDAVVRQPCDRTDPIVTEHEAEASSGRQIRIEWNREHVPLHSQVHNVDRYLEEAMFKAVAAAGLAPPLLGFDHYHAGILARGWIDGAHSLSVDECREGTRTARNVVEALVELHNIPPSAVKEADVDEHLRGEIHAKFLPSQRIRTRLAYISETLASGVVSGVAPLPAYVEELVNRTIELERAILSAHVSHDLVVVYGDVGLPETLLVDGNSKIWFTSFEWSGIGDRFWDLAALAARLDLPQADERALIDHYLVHLSRADMPRSDVVEWNVRLVYARNHLMKIVLNVSEGLRVLAQHLLGETTYDFEDRKGERWNDGLTLLAGARADLDGSEVEAGLVRIEHHIKAHETAFHHGLLKK